MNQSLTQVLENLDVLLPIVAKVHGQNHPELNEVLCLYKKLRANPEDPVRTGEIFEKLRNSAKDFVVPTDACQTYAEVYQWLSELPELFQKNEVKN